MAYDYELKYFNDIERKTIDWLWYPYIPYGKITLVQGDPGEGKTTMLISIISLLSKGEPFPFTNKKTTAVSIYQNAEDDVADTIKPKLEIHRANCNNVCYIEKKNDNIFMDDDSIENAIVKSGAKLFVLDPIQAFIGDNVDMNRANVIRPRMNKLKEIAQKTGCAVVLVGHMNKNSTGKSNYRNLGSIDISAAARSVLVVGRLSKSSEIKVLAQLKNNLAPKGKSITFKIENRTVRWISECSLTADDLLSCSLSGGGYKRTVAENLIHLSLEDGMKTAKSIFDKAQEQGISIRTLKTVKSTMPVRSLKKNGIWYWEMNSQEVGNNAEQ